MQQVGPESPQNVAHKCRKPTRAIRIKYVLHLQLIKESGFGHKRLRQPSLSIALCYCGDRLRLTETMCAMMYENDLLRTHNRDNARDSNLGANGSLDCAQN